MYWIEYLFDLGELGPHPGIAVGTVEESEHGYIRVEIKKAVVYLMDKNSKAFEVDVTQCLSNACKAHITEQIEYKWSLAKDGLIDQGAG